MKKLLLVVAFCCILTIPMHAAAPEYSHHDLDPDRIYLVHASHFLIKQNTVIAGASAIHSKTSERFLLPRDMVMEMRKTLHHGFGGLIPSDAMGEEKYWEGVRMIFPSDGHDITPFAYLDLVSNFLKKKEVIGGRISDVFTTSHVYAQGSIVIIPKTNESDFRNSNTDYSGELVLYDPKEKNLRSIVDEILKLKNALHITLEEQEDNSFLNPISLYKKVYINGKQIPLFVFEEFFRAQQLITVDHNYSHFGLLENVLGDLREVFVRFYLYPEESIWEKSLPSKHISALVALADFEFEQVFKLTANLHENQRRDLELWHKDCLAFIKLHKFEMELRKENKSLFRNNPRFSEHLKMRGTLSLEVLKAELKPLSQEQILEIETKTETPGMRYAIPQYFIDLKYANLSDYEQLTSFMKGKMGEWPFGPGVILINLFKRYFLYNEAIENMANVFNFATEGLLSLLKKKTNPGVVAKIKDKFWEEASNDSSEHGIYVLSLLNHPRINPLFRRFLGFTKENVTFEALLRMCPKTQILPNVPPLFYESTGFLREKYKTITFSNLKEATFHARKFQDIAFEILDVPLEDIAMLLKQNGLGTPEEVFASMGLRDQFKKRFPTQDDFLKFKPRPKEFGYFSDMPAFVSVYDELSKASLTSL